MKLKVALIFSLVASGCLFASEAQDECSSEKAAARKRQSVETSRDAAESHLDYPDQIVVDVPVVGEVNVGQTVAEGAWKAGEAYGNWKSGQPIGTTHAPPPPAAVPPTSIPATGPTHVGPTNPYSMPSGGNGSLIGVAGAVVDTITNTVSEAAWEAGEAYGNSQSGAPVELNVSPDYNYSTSGAQGKAGMK